MKRISNLEPTIIYDKEELIGSTVRLKSVSMQNCQCGGTILSSSKDYTIKDVEFRLSLDGKCFTLISLEGVTDRRFTLKDLVIKSLNYSMINFFVGLSDYYKFENYTEKTLDVSKGIVGLNKDYLDTFNLKGFSSAIKTKKIDGVIYPYTGKGSLDCIEVKDNQFIFVVPSNYKIDSYSVLNVLTNEASTARVYTKEECDERAGEPWGEIEESMYMNLREIGTTDDGYRVYLRGDYLDDPQAISYVCNIILKKA